MPHRPLQRLLALVALLLAPFAARATPDMKGP